MKICSTYIHTYWIRWPQSVAMNNPQNMEWHVHSVHILPTYILKHSLLTVSAEAMAAPSVSVWIVWICDVLCHRYSYLYVKWLLCRSVWQGQEKVAGQGDGSRHDLRSFRICWLNYSHWYVVISCSWRHRPSVVGTAGTWWELLLEISCIEITHNTDTR